MRRIEEHLQLAHGSLFSGIGGFDLAAEWAGWENMFHCEWNGFGKRVLNYYWPNAISYGDITKTDFTIWRGRIDVLSGGFPCQPYSLAGKRLGKEDERHLWLEMLRAIREIQPSWVVGENVLGITNWNGGLVFNEVQTDLEAEGYEVQAYVLPAAAVNAPHRRDRVWFVAHSYLHGQQRINGKYEKQSSQRGQYAQRNIEPSCQYGNVADTEGSKSGQQTEWQGRQSIERGGSDHGRNKTEGGVSITNPSSQRLQGIKKRGSPRKSREESNKHPTGRICSTWQNFPTQSPVCGGDDGLPRELDGITFPKWRTESIKAYGNAIVPQVAKMIFQAINEYETQHKHNYEHKRSTNN